MAIIEIHGGPINHRYLMKKSKDELASMYMRLLRDTEQDAKDAERYRWIRSTTAPGYLHFPSGEIQDGLALDALDAAIDAAMNGANT